MIYRIAGELIAKRAHSLVADTNGVGYKIAVGERTIRALPALGTRVVIFTHLHVREDAMDLFGFLHEDDLAFFELLISVSGVGPKSALSVLDVADLDSLMAAIKEGRPDMLTRASGIGRKTAERIILELQSKVEAVGADVTVKKMEADSDIVETLVSLGYKKDQARSALQKIPADIASLEARLKAALKLLTAK